MVRLIAQRIRTPDSTILQTFRLHDYKSHVDVLTGENYVLDGGTTTLYINTNIVPPEDLNVYDTDHFALQRDAFCWGTRGPEIRDPLIWKSLRNLDTAYIQNMLNTRTDLEDWVRSLFTQELAFRA